MTLDIFEKEKVASEKRFWLRTTRRCNNHCIFCHDSEIQNGEIIKTEELQREIKEAYKNGYTRLILSGGEPTIHPDIIKLIEFAKRTGFEWIQIISNGRMFAYSEFTSKIISAGLNEVTISFHSHKEEIADKLTDIKGSYKQTLSGIENLRKYNNLVISIDIVINKYNVYHLKDSIEFFFTRYKISEFDLLHLTPFGRALTNYNLLKPDPLIESREIKKTIDFAKRNNIVIWTNRVPPNLLEGNEEYIQDPHKIKDEIYGRSEIFKKYLSNGILECKNIKRCTDCFVREFCEFLIEINTRYQKRRIEYIEITRPPSNMLIEKIFDHITYNAAIITPPEYIDVIKEEIAGSKKTIILKTNSIDGIQKVIEEIGCKYVISENLDILNLKGVKPLLILTRDNIGRIKPIRGLRFIFPNSPTMVYESEKIPDIRDIKKIVSEYNIKISNLPKCISKTNFSNHPYYFKSEFITEEGLDLDAITEDFLLNRNYQKSLRCIRCAYNDQCKGIHINHIRRFGFKILKPLTK